MSDIISDWSDGDKALNRKLGEKLSGSEDSFRTAKVTEGAKTTTYETRGGRPQVTVSEPPPAPAECSLFPITEMTLLGAETQAERLYYHDHDADPDVPVKYVHSGDGLLSIVIKPLLRIRLKSIKLNKMITLWLNDHSVDDANVAQVDIAANPTFGDSVVGIKAVEQARANQGGSGLLREYYAPVYSPNKQQEISNGVTYLIKRIKKLVLKITGFSGVPSYTVIFGDYDSGAEADVSSGVSKRAQAVEKKISTRTFYTAGTPDPKKVKTSTFDSGGKLTIATPGGWLEPFSASSCDKLRLIQYSSKPTSVLPLTSCSDVVTFGQAWHGFLEETNNGSGTRILWDAIERNSRVLTHNTNLANGPLVNLSSVMLGVYNRYYNFNLPATPVGDCKNYAVIHQGVLGPLTEGVALLPTYDSPGSADILYRDNDGVVWKISVAGEQVLTLWLAVVTITGRLDDFLETKITVSREIARFLISEGGSPTLVVKNSPDSKTAALLVYPTLTAEVLNGYHILTFEGVGDLVGASYGAGITCSHAGVTTWQEVGPLGMINNPINITDKIVGGLSMPTSTAGRGVGTRELVALHEVSHVGDVYTYSHTREIYKNESLASYSVSENRTMVDIVFNRVSGVWDRVDFFKRQTLTISDAYTGFLGQIETVTVNNTQGNVSTTQNPPAPYITLMEVRYAYVFEVGYSVGWVSLTGLNRTGTRFVVDEYTYTDGSSPNSSRIIDTSTGFGDMENIDQVLIGYRGYGTPYVGRCLLHTPSSTFSKMTYDGAVSSFIATDGELTRFAYDHHLQKIHKLPATSAGVFV